MNKRLQILFLLSLSGLMLATPVFAQDNETAAPSETEAGETVAEEEISDSQEVEITEDNYRQFMELKDAMRQRDVIPENVFKPGSGLQKLDKLPEESQKHLRNQLREIIVQGDEWQPGDEETEYPYTPSPAASTNPALEKQELEAWGELVDSYHERESQIYENSSGMQTARGSEQGSSNSQQDGAGSSDRQGQNGEGSEGQQAGQEGNPNQSETEGTYSVNGSGNPDAMSTAGVSQNAMEFLQGLGKGGGGSGESNQGDSTEGDGSGGKSPTPSEARSQAQTGQQGGSEQNRSDNSESPGSYRDPNANSTAGTSQNAMEFLKGSSEQSGSDGEEQALSDVDGQQEGQSSGQESAQGSVQDSGQSETQGDQQADDQNEGETQDDQQSEGEQESALPSPTTNDSTTSPAETEEESTAGAAQNALEYLTGENTQHSVDKGNEADSEQQQGTLTIQDLLNAQGVDGAPANPADENQVDKTNPEKDGEG